jgi:hypothetical protein
MKSNIINDISIQVAGVAEKFIWYRSAAGRNFSDLGQHRIQ